ncbi:MAG: hypothetical protein CMD54_05070 [Gammaproteobacteria bacterium]|nr:hypothetical protein [Gammaproteobacteria bacterium]
MYRSVSSYIYSLNKIGRLSKDHSTRINPSNQDYENTGSMTQHATVLHLQKFSSLLFNGSFAGTSKKPIFTYSRAFLE